MATAITEESLGEYPVSVHTRLPHRFSEGYGLSPKIIDEIDTGLVITVDNGISAYDAIRKAKEKGLAVIVIDHHLPPVDETGKMKLPPADIIVDPHIEQESEFSDYAELRGLINWHVLYVLKMICPNYWYMLLSLR